MCFYNPPSMRYLKHGESDPPLPLDMSESLIFSRILRMEKRRALSYFCDDAVDLHIAITLQWYVPVAVL